MKQKFLMGLGVLALTLSACTEDWGNAGREGSGYIVPTVDVDLTTISSQKLSTRAELSSLTKNDLTLTLTKNDGSFSWSGSYAEFPVDKAFSIGDYTLEASFGDPAQQDFEKPALFGSQNLTVEDGKTTQISLRAAPSNSQITIEYTDAFKSYMNDWSAEVNGVEYSKEETRPVYVAPGPVKIKLNVTKANGVYAEFTLDDVLAKARYAYKVLIDVNGGEVGDAVLKVTYDDNFEEEEIEIDLSDKALNSPAPEIDITGFVSNSPITIISGLSETSELALSLIAQAGINSVTLSTSSESLLSQGWPEMLNLMEADPSQQSILKSLGLSVLGLWKSPGEMAYLDFSKVAEHIAYLSEGNNESSFILTLKDKLMRECETVVLKFIVTPISLSLESADEYYDAGTPLKVKLAFNGSLEQINKISFQYFDYSGMWRNVTLNSVEEKNGEYFVTLNIPASHNDDVDLRAVCGGVTSETVTIGMAPFSIDVNDKNVFATHAFVKTFSTSEDFIIEGKTPKFYAKGGSWNEFTEVKNELDNGYYKLSGLESAKSYQVKVSYDGFYSKSVNINTEAAAELPNGDFENLTETFSFPNLNQGGRWGVGLWVYYQNYVTYAISEPNGWATNNPKTLSGSNQNTWFCQPAVFNSNLSYSSQCVGTGIGTGRETKTPDAYKYSSKSGDNAMVIRNVAWDATGSKINDWEKAMAAFSEYYNHNVPTLGEKSVGKMFLGTYEYANGAETSSEGYDFTSRPSKLTGSYQYFLDKNSNQEDNGVLSVMICNGNEIIAQSIYDLTASSSYKDFEINLKYNKEASKANKIKIEIKSSNKNDNDINVTTYNTTHDSYMYGATLVIDNLKFEY